MEKIYHIAEGKNIIGHYTLTQLKELELKDSFIVWTEGNEEWKNILEFDELKLLVIRTPPPISKKENRQNIIETVRNRINESSKLKLTAKIYLVIVVVCFIYMGGLSSDTKLESINNSVAEKIYTNTITELRLIILYTSCLVSLFITPISIWSYNRYKVLNLNKG